MKAATRRERAQKDPRISHRSIGQVVERIVREFDPERVILFGSYAYDHPHPYSDVDLLVVLKTSERPLAKQLEIARALSPHPFGLDILVSKPEQLKERIAMGDHFYREIIARGRLLYERLRR